MGIALSLLPFSWITVDRKGLNLLTYFTEEQGTVKITLSCKNYTFYSF